MVQELIGQGDPNLRSCACADPRNATGVAVSAMSVVHSLSPPTTESPGDDSMRDPHTTVRSDQVAIALDEAEPAGESDLPIVGVPGSPRSILGPSAAAGV